MILMDSSWHPQIMHLQIHYLNLCSGKFLWAYFFTINNLSLQQSILYDIIVYMALNKTFNVFHVSIKTIPRKAKHFIRWNPLNYQPDLWQIVNTRNLSIRYLTLQAGIIFMQKLSLIQPYKKSHSTDHKSILPVYPNNSITYHKIHIWRIYSSKHWESHIISTHHHATDFKIRHLPQLILDPGQKYLFITPFKKCILREQISILLSYPNKLSPEHIKWKLTSDFSSKHCKSTLSNFTHDLALALISHRSTLYIEKTIICASIYCTWKSTRIFPMKKCTWEIINQFNTSPLPTIQIYI